MRTTKLLIFGGDVRVNDNLKSAYLSTLRNLTSNDLHKVYVVSGAPASGKTTYVQNHKNKGDLVFDLDYICAALGGTNELYENHKPYLDVALAVRDTVYEMIRNRDGKWKNAYVITAQKDSDKVKALVNDLDAELIHIDSSKEECIENARNDTRRKDSLDEHIKIINEYYN